MKGSKRPGFPGKWVDADQRLAMCSFFLYKPILFQPDPNSNSTVQSVPCSLSHTQISSNPDHWIWSFLISSHIVLLTVDTTVTFTIHLPGLDRHYDPVWKTSKYFVYGSYIFSLVSFKTVFNNLFSELSYEIYSLYNFFMK